MACNLGNTYRALGSTIQPSNLPDSCGNWCKNVSGTGSILDQFGCGVTTLGQAMDLLAQEIASRIGSSSFQVVAISTNSYTMTFKLSLEACNVGTATISAIGNGSFPITVQWERPKRGTSGTAMVQTLDSFINLLVAQFKK